MTMTQYVVTAPCLVHVPFDTPQGRQLGTLYTDAVVPASVPKEKIEFWLDAGMIREVKPASEPEQEEPSGAEVSKSQGPTPEREGDLVAPPTGGAGSGKDAWVDYAVATGKYDREAAEGMTRDDLIKALKPADPAE